MRLHVVDGTFELYRAHFSPRPGHTTPDGRDWKATVGVVASLMALLADPGEAVTHLAVAFDNPIRSFRNDLFAGYKSDEGVPPELRAQFDAVEVAVRALGVHVWSMDRFEADDAMATAAVRFADQVDEVRLMTPDKDLGQCLGSPRVVQVDRMRNRVIDAAAFRARYGIEPASMPDYLALVGDSADGIPGIPGFGAKTAAALLLRYGRLEDVPDDARTWDVPIRGAVRLGDSLAARRDEAFLFRRLATLVTEVPLVGTLEELAHRGVDPVAWQRFCAESGRTDWYDRATPRSSNER